MRLNCLPFSLLGLTNFISCDLMFCKRCFLAHDTADVNIIRAYSNGGKLDQWNWDTFIMRSQGIPWGRPRTTTLP